MVVLVEERVINLEGMMARLIRTVEQTSRQLTEYKEDTDRHIKRIDRQIAEYKAETDRRIAEHKEETDRHIERMDRQIAEYRVETNKQIKEDRRLIGELSDRMGRLVEDLIAPRISRIIGKVIDLPNEPITSAIRVKRHNAEGKRQQFDAIAVCGPYWFVNETKTSLRPDYVSKFADETLPKVRDYFPEYADKQIIGIVASLYVDESLVRYAERKGLVVLGFGEDVMDVLNDSTFW